MTHQDMLAHMLLVATTRHHGQFDKGGQPYILHTLKVMYWLKSDDPELQCIAVGHDLIEDTFIGRGQTLHDGIVFLQNEGFSPRVIAGIVAMTKLPGQSYEAYKAQVKGNADAVRVKKSDLRHNSDIRRLKGVTQKDLDRVMRYLTFYEELKAVEV